MSGLTNLSYQEPEELDSLTIHAEKVSITLRSLIEIKQCEIINKIEKAINKAKDKIIEYVVDPHVKQLELNGFNAEFIYNSTFKPNMEDMIRINLIDKTQEEINTSMQNLLFNTFLKLAKSNDILCCNTIKESAVKQIEDYFNGVHHSIFVEPEMTIEEMIHKLVLTLIPVFDSNIIVQFQYI